MPGNIEKIAGYKKEEYLGLILYPYFA